MLNVRNGVLEALPGHELLRSDPGQLRGERTPAEAVQVDLSVHKGARRKQCRHGTTKRAKRVDPQKYRKIQNV